MAKAKKKEKELQSWKKKKWYSMVAPKAFNSAFLGESTVYEKQNMLGKTVVVNLMNLTGESKNQNVNLKFKVASLQGDQAETEIVSYVLSPAFIKRIVRRRHTRIDSTVPIITKDQKSCIIKPLLITRNLATRSEITGLRHVAEAQLKKLAEETAYDDLLKDIIYNKLQLEMKKRLAKTYPLKSFEVKKLNLVGGAVAKTSA
jgi:small subunit ribosomal protein S3Ae